MAAPDGLRALIDVLFHPPAGSAPAITSLATYLELKASADTINALFSTDPAAAKSAIAAMEAQVLAATASGQIINTAQFQGPKEILFELEGLAARLP